MKLAATWLIWPAQKLWINRRPTASLRRWMQPTRHEWCSAANSKSQRQSGAAGHRCISRCRCGHRLVSQAGNKARQNPRQECMQQNNAFIRVNKTDSIHPTWQFQWLTQWTKKAFVTSTCWQPLVKLWTWFMLMKPFKSSFWIEAVYKDSGWNWQGCVWNTKEEKNGRLVKQKGDMTDGAVFHLSAPLSGRKQTEKIKK